MRSRSVEQSLAPEVMETLNGRWEPVYRSQLHYLVTWGTREHRAVLRDRHAHALTGFVEQVCEERGHTLLEVRAGADHVHLLMALRPTHSVSSVVRELKSRTGAGSTAAGASLAAPSTSNAPRYCTGLRPSPRRRADEATATTGTRVEKTPRIAKSAHRSGPYPARTIFQGGVTHAQRIAAMENV